jgi:hypothetical protein
MVEITSEKLNDIINVVSGLTADLMPVILFMGGIGLAIFIISSILGRNNDNE